MAACLAASLKPSAAAKVVAEFTRLADGPTVRHEALVELLSDREREVIRC